MSTLSHVDSQVCERCVLRLQRVACADARYGAPAHSAAPCPLCVGVLQHDTTTPDTEHALQNAGGAPLESDQPGAWARCPSFACDAVAAAVRDSGHDIDLLAIQCKVRQRNPVNAWSPGPGWSCLARSPARRRLEPRQAAALFRAARETP